MIRKHSLPIKKVLAEFQKAEASSAHRKGTFKINVPFDDALRTVLKAKPNHKVKR